MNRKEFNLLVEGWRSFLNENESISMPSELLEAWNNTTDEHLNESFKQRAPGGAGSTFDEQVTLDKLKNASWKIHPDPKNYVREPAIAYVTNDFGGVLGMLPVGSLDRSERVKFQPAHMGKAFTDDGDVIYEAVASFKGGRPQRKNTTLLIGPKWKGKSNHAKDESKNVVWTFFPGDPTPPPNPNAPKYILADDIRKLGLEETASGFIDQDGNDMIAFKGTIKNAKELGYGNIKYVDSID
jgi:hypothetical protein